MSIREDSSLAKNQGIADWNYAQSTGSAGNDWVMESNRGWKIF